jgi:hypothetical protein
MATVRRFNSVPARKMRMAISLRLAASSFLNGRIFPWPVPDFALTLFDKLIQAFCIIVQTAKCKVLVAAK